MLLIPSQKGWGWGVGSTDGHLPLPLSFSILSRALESVSPIILLGLGSKHIVIHYGDKLDTLGEGYQGF